MAQAKKTTARNRAFSGNKKTLSPSAVRAGAIRRNSVKKYDYEVTIPMSRLGAVVMLTLASPAIVIDRAVDSIRRLF